MYTMSELIRRYHIIKETLPRGKYSKWAEYRFEFGHSEAPVYAAQNAIAEMMHCGPQTRERWKWEYRHHRQLIAILRGTDYEEDDASYIPPQTIAL